jgi:hypothetical protein
VVAQAETNAELGEHQSHCGCVYALLNRGTNLLASDALVEVTVGGETIQPKNVEAGTGYYEHTWIRNEVRPEMGEITLRKSDEGCELGQCPLAIP